MLVTCFDDGWFDFRQSEQRADADSDADSDSSPSPLSPLPTDRPRSRSSRRVRVALMSISVCSRTTRSPHTLAPHLQAYTTSTGGLLVISAVTITGISMSSLTSWI
jgi:hypothetical protein